MKIRPALAITLTIGLCLFASGWIWFSNWTQKNPLPTSGGLPFPTRWQLPVPHFQQNDPEWAHQPLGPTSQPLAKEGCAVACAAMVLAARNIPTNPGKLNKFLSAHPKGYTKQGWIYWESAAEYDPSALPSLLPHYEDLPSFQIIDLNLLTGNPVIARLRLPTGITHFVVIIGKHGFDYIIHDPAKPPAHPPSLLRDLPPPIEAIRFYKNPTFQFSPTPHFENLKSLSP